MVIRLIKEYCFSTSNEPCPGPLSPRGGRWSRLDFTIQKPVIAFLLLVLMLPVTYGFAEDEGAALDFDSVGSSRLLTPREEGIKLFRLRHRPTLPDTGRSCHEGNKRASVKRMPSETVLLRKLTAKSAIVMDAWTGETVYAYCANLPGQPASTIKVLTGLISVRALKKGDMVYTSRRAARMPRSKIFLRRGKSYPADDLINAVLLASANDASVALAEKIAGSEWAFAKLMTRMAREMGAKATVCKTATGLTRGGQKSTVRDLAVIFNKAMKNTRFASRMARKKVKTRGGKILMSHNKALWNMVGAEGGKTGYTRAAGQTYVGKFRREDDELVVAIMGSKSRWQDVRNLVNYGFARKQQKRTTNKRLDASEKGALRPDTL